MKTGQLIEKIKSLDPSGEVEVKVLEGVSGDITELNDVSFSHLNGGEIHLTIELEYED